MLGLFFVFIVFIGIIGYYQFFHEEAGGSNDQLHS